MERYYPQYLWCNKYRMWCDDVPDLTDGQNDCNGDCNGCDEGENIN